MTTKLTDAEIDRLIEQRDELASDLARRGEAWVGTEWFAARARELRAIGEILAGY